MTFNLITKLKKRGFLIVLLCAAGYYLFIYSNLPGGYTYVDYSSYSDAIKKGEEYVITPMVLNVKHTKGYITGIKLPLDVRKCYHSYENGRTTFSSSVEVLYLPEFFIIFSETGEVSRFKNQKKFEAMLDKLGISKKIEVDYSLFDKFWDGLPKTAHWDNFANEDCPIPSKEEYEYSQSIMLDVDSGFRTLEEIHATLKN